MSALKYPICGTTPSHEWSTTRLVKVLPSSEGFPQLAQQQQQQLAMASVNDGASQNQKAPNAAAAISTAPAEPLGDEAEEKEGAPPCKAVDERGEAPSSSPSYAKPLPLYLPLPPIVSSDTFGNVNKAYYRNGIEGVGKFIKWRVGDGGLPRPSPSATEAARLLPSVAVDPHAVGRFDPWRCPCAANAAVSGGGHACHSPSATATNSGHGASGADEDSHLIATWTSHASFIVTAGGYTVLTDPVWSRRASPMQCAGPGRMVPPPIPLKGIPYIDVVTISHNHYDHLDTACVKHLIKSNHRLAAQRAAADGFMTAEAAEGLASHPIFVVPMGMKKRWFEDLASSVPELDLDRVVELMWWDTADVTAAVAANRAMAAPSTAKVANGTTTGATTTSSLPPFTIAAVPVQHWALRTGFDHNKELWCGFIFTVGATATPPATQQPLKFFHSGDTGYYQPLFEAIGAACGPIDFAMVPIGAYEPRAIMGMQHVDPFEAVRIHKDIKSLHSAGMHWGTFALTFEPVDEPPKALAVAMAETEGAVPITEGGSTSETDRHHAKLKALRARGFTLSSAKSAEEGTAGVEGETSSSSISRGAALPSPTLITTAPASSNVAEVLPYYPSERPFRALKHGESWRIPRRGTTVDGGAAN